MSERGVTIDGDTWETAIPDSTAGAQLISQFKAKYDALEHQIRSNQLTQSQQGKIAEVGMISSSGKQLLQNQLTGMSGMGNLMNMYGTQLQPYQAYNQLGYMTDMYNAQAQAGFLNSMMGAGGMLGVAALA